MTFSLNDNCSKLGKHPFIYKRSYCSLGGRSLSNLLPNSVVMNGDHIMFYAPLFSMIAISLAYRVESVPMLTEDLKFKPVLHHLETLLT